MERNSKKIKMTAYKNIFQIIKMFLKNIFSLLSSKPFYKKEMERNLKNLKNDCIQFSFWFLFLVFMKGRFRAALLTA